MIVFFIITTLFIVSLAAAILTHKKSKTFGSDMKLLSDEEINKLTEDEKIKYQKWEGLEGWNLKLLVPTVLFGLLFVLSIANFTNHLPGERDRILSEKSLIIYKAQNGEYEDNGDMITAIDEFNDDLKRKQKAIENPWVNWYVSRHYKDVEPINYTIDLEGIEYKN